MRHKAWLAEHTARSETQLASKIKSEFIANVSDERQDAAQHRDRLFQVARRAPGATMRDTEVVEYADLIRDAATHLLAVINDILDISKMQSGKFTLDAREVDLDEVLQASLASFKQSAVEVDVLLESRIDPNPPMIKGDPDKLRQVFSNLIGNAVKFTPPGAR